MEYTGWLYEFTVILYALSVLGYFIDFLQHNRKVNRMAFWLLSIVWVFQTIYFIEELLRLGEFPILTPSDGLFFYAWVLVTLSLFINRFFRVDFFVFFTNVLGFIIMSIYLFAPGGEASNVLSKQLTSGLLVIHVTIAFLAYGAFTLSFIFSIMYLIQHRMLKEKKWNRRMLRFGSLSQLEQASFICNMVGVPLLAISLILGMIWASIQLRVFYWLDAKVILSFVVIFVYSIFLYQKVAKGTHGKTLVFWNTTAFLVVLINYFLSESLTQFHLWYQ
ncbi:MAG TPA: cytochrome c biogenesis protein CcsA [Bacillales bacterium]|nr:cytochrome c biogenesis protein CcsA [Bacillales bacterium]